MMFHVITKNIFSLVNVIGGRQDGRVAMDAKRNTIPDIVRNTLEYHEALTILAEKAKLRAEVARINAELRQLRRLSPEAVELAKTDSQDGEKD
jgi:hypothetical protein